jgi:hypothetical protein
MGIAGVIVQIALGVLSFSVLIIKRYHHSYMCTDINSIPNDHGEYGPWTPPSKLSHKPLLTSLMLVWLPYYRRYIIATVQSFYQ